MNRTYEYILKPNKYQKAKIDFNLFCVNKIRNYCLEKSKVGSIKHSAKNLTYEFIKTDKRYENCDFSALINELFVLSCEIKPKYPSNKHSYTTAYSDFLKTNYSIGSTRVFLSKVGWVKYINTRPLPANESITKFVIKKDCFDKYYLHLVFDNEPTARELDSNNSIGFDYSSTHFMVDNNGIKYDMPHFYRQSEKEIQRINRKLSKMTSGSNRSIRKLNDLQKINRKITNRRKDWLHKLSTKIANEYDYVVVEDLEMIKIAKSFKLGKSTNDNSYYKFVKMLDYKMEDRGKKLIKIDKYFPSSKMCSNCGYINKSLKLGDRHWICPDCNSNHDRDINAAINIRNAGLGIINAAGQAARH